MSTLIIIPARKGSKGIKNKNKIKVNGKKLIEYTFEIVNKLNFKSFNKSKNALGQAMNDSSKNDVVFVIGSVYLISEILS